MKITGACKKIFIKRVQKYQIEVEAGSQVKGIGFDRVADLRKKKRAICGICSAGCWVVVRRSGQDKQGRA